jgi:hypothetical protein
LIDTFILPSVPARRWGDLAGVLSIALSARARGELPGFVVHAIIYIQLVFTRGKDGTGYDSAPGTSNVLSGAWHHVIGTYDGSTIKIYVDGILQASKSWSSGLDGATATAYIGQDDYDSSRRFTGLIDDVRIYNRALSADEIKRLYKIGATGKLSVVSNSTSLDKGLVGWWTFDGKDVSGVQVYDKSGNGNRGIMTEGPTTVEGKLGQTLSFDEGDDYVDISDSSVFDLAASGKYTWSAWIKPRNFNQWSAVRSQLQSSNPEIHLTYYAHTSNSTSWGPVTAGVSVGWVTGITNYVSLYSTNNVLTIGSWSHLVITYDGSLAQANRFTIYVNGTDVTDRSDVDYVGTATDITPTAGNINIGRDGSFGDMGQDTVDDVRISNRALSADEVKRLYNMGR